MKLSRRSGAQARHSAVPAVNLLSPWTFEALAVRRVRNRFVLAAAVFVLIVGAAWGVQQVRIGQAEKVLTVEQAETARLTTQSNELAPVRGYVADVDHQKVLVHDAMVNEVSLSRVLVALRDATPAAANVETMALTVTPAASSAGAAVGAAPGPTGGSCPGPDPFHTHAVVGCITLSGKADSRATVGDFVVNLDDDDLFVDPFISATTTAQGDDVVFTGSVGLSGKALSHRYADIDQLLEQGRTR